MISKLIELAEKGIIPGEKTCLQFESGVEWRVFYLIYIAIAMD